MNRAVLYVIAFMLGAVVCQGRAVAEGDCPEWLLPRSSLEKLLIESPTGLFPDFYSSPVFPFVIDSTEQTVRIELKEMTVAQRNIFLIKAERRIPLQYSLCT